MSHVEIKKINEHKFKLFIPFILIGCNELCMPIYRYTYIDVW